MRTFSRSGFRQGSDLPLEIGPEPYIEHVRYRSEYLAIETSFQPPSSSNGEANC